VIWLGPAMGTETRPRVAQLLGDSERQTLATAIAPPSSASLRAPPPELASNTTREVNYESDDGARPPLHPLTWHNNRGGSNTGSMLVWALSILSRGVTIGVDPTWGRRWFGQWPTIMWIQSASSSSRATH
jgi:hypothetical protein